MPSPERRPLVSAIVPAWNAERTIMETLNSISAQTYDNLEIVIIDDGSIDGTAELTRAFCAGEPRARLVSKENGGVISARNRGIAEANGEWIAPIDSDDLWHPSKIEKQVAAALAAPERPGFVYCWYRHIDEDGRIIGSGPRWQFDGPALRRCAYLNPVQNGSALLISREAADAVGGYDPILRAADAEGCEDVLVELQICRRYPIAAVPEHLVGYRQRAGSLSSANKRMVRSWKLTYEILLRDGADIPPALIRRKHAFLEMTIVLDRIAHAAYLEAIRPMLRALRGDPLRWGSYILYRIARTFMRLVRGRRKSPDSLNFLAASPGARILTDPDDVPRVRALLDQIEERRLRRLARDEKLEAHRPVPARIAASRLSAET